MLPFKTKFISSKEKFKHLIKLNRARIVMVGLIITISYSFLNMNSYSDPLNLCFIKINKSLNGNRNTIRKAILKIKKGDKFEYKTICKYVNTINEDYCIVKDPQIHKSEAYQPNCYIRGSKIIHLFPYKENNESIVNLRSQMIKKYANYSKDFWESEIK